MPDLALALAWSDLTWPFVPSCLLPGRVLPCLPCLALPRLCFPLPGLPVLTPAPFPAPRGPCLLPSSNAKSSFNSKFDISGHHQSKPWPCPAD
ncbi:hypothetical protein LY78DRAFT_660715 [Colletotrichum sublineola]|nr:hypothetical protein LY78DRAFT_660715 [Colletotrichum sublineola]